MNLKLDLVRLMPPTHARAERAPSSCLLPVVVLFQDSAVVPGLIDTIDTVMSHITYNLQASKPQVAIVGSSSMAGSLAVWVWVRLAVWQVGAGGRGGAGNAACLLNFAALLHFLAPLRQRGHLRPGAPPTPPHTAGGSQTGPPHGHNDCSGHSFFRFLFPKGNYSPQESSFCQKKKQRQMGFYSPVSCPGVD